MKSGRLDLEEVEKLIGKLGGEDRVRSFLSDELGVTFVEKGNKKPPLLIPAGNYSAISAGELHHDPAQFFKNREGLFVGSFFRDQIVAAANSTRKQFKRTLRFELAKPATGEELLAERPQSVWEAGDFCGWLAQKLSKQTNGEAGEISRDNWTIALVRGVNGAVLVVLVCWVPVHRFWRVSASVLSDGWGAGSQFVSHN